ncbi:hypothetical protein PRIPAC_97250 [Pristionchus pacificus]|uniref:glucuronosyltransferase n=1 Tax=Pristionchus pacificus TaxID=54126 RepID=A0A2A6BIQ5_PRIPA|nr:hypothetical protein PRIPAC_97250 [Pristionchus pacificus]|eukprot:PDM65782.1 glucuronosyltransferase [Pristionchus pacificus]
MNRLPCFALLAYFLPDVASYKILVYNSRYGHSHSNFLGNIADILVETGHDVTSLIPIIDPRVNDVTEKSKKIFIQRSDEVESILSGLSSIRANFFKTSIFDPIGVYKHRTMFTLHFVAQCRAVLNETTVIERLRNEKFDVMIVENFDMCGVALSHLLQPRSLITSGAGYPFAHMLEEFGLPLALSYNPSSFTTHLDVHSMWSRMRNIYANWLMHFHFYPRRQLIEELFRERFGSDFPSLEEISSHAAYTLTNSEPLIDYAAPTLNRVLSIPGIGAKQPKALNEHWNAILAQRPKTILISFGSVAKSVDLPPTVKQSITAVIGRFPEITFIWKIQRRLFRMSNCQRGRLRMICSMTIESRRIFVPIFGDQPRNSGMMEHNGLGKVLDKFDLEYPDKVEAVIREVLTDRKYAEKSRQVSAMLAKKPFTSREILIKTVEFAAEFGPSAALRPQSYDMNIVVYHNLDIFACATVFFVLLAYAAVRSVTRIMTSLIMRQWESSGKSKTA